MKKFCILAIILAAVLIVGNEIVAHTAITRSMDNKSSALINGQIFSLEVADDPLEQTQGLSNHKPINDHQGMLFVFADRQARTFWMKDMLFPLDIIWIDNGRIVKIDKNLPPEGDNPETTYPSAAPIDMVLEINAGLADKYNLKAGDKITVNL